LRLIVKQPILSLTIILALATGLLDAGNVFLTLASADLTACCLPARRALKYPPLRSPER
jgi:hypothetical protein